jgi:serine/threonine protein kinase
MPQIHRCQGCGAARPVDAPASLCPACLLRQGLVGSADSAATAIGAFSASNTNRGRFIPPTPAELAPRFPQLEIIELLGQGGMGAVYKARQPRLDRMVAIKILPPEAAADPAFAERFTREARALARLSHPGIVAIYDFGQTGDIYYLTMEYVEGRDLRALIHDHKLEPAEALQIIPQICDALEYAHGEAVVHRDIKPENVLIDRKGRVKIADFGLAKLLDPGPHDGRLTGTRQVMGTWRYMAPEQLDNPLAVDHRADIYSLGVVFYELLTGELPIGRFAVPSQKVKLDTRLDDVVLKALENEPDRRYQHASDVRSEIDSIEATPEKKSESTPQLEETAQPFPAATSFNFDGFFSMANAALAGDHVAIERLKRVLTWIMGTISSVLFFAWFFEIIPGNLGLFLWLATGCLTWGVEMDFSGNELGTTDPKLEAAMAIRDPKVREGALNPIILEAAENGDGEVVQLALSALVVGLHRDRIAAQAAIKLAELGDSANALATAQMIADRDARDDALACIAAK